MWRCLVVWYWLMLCAWLPLQAAETPLAPTLQLSAEHPQPLHPIERVHVVAKHWPGYTNPDFSGGYFDFVRLVLASPDFQLDIELTQFSRAISLVKLGHADLVLAVTAEDAEQLLLSAQPMDVDRVIMVAKSELQLNTPLLSMPPAHMAKLRVGWDLGYNYGAALGLTVMGYEVQSPQHGIDMVRKGRLDLYLAEQTELYQFTSIESLQSMGLEVTPVTVIPIYIGFSKTERGQALKQAWDHRLQTQTKNGQLQQFYHRYPELKPPEGAH